MLSSSSSSSLLLLFNVAKSYSRSPWGSSNNNINFYLHFFATSSPLMASCMSVGRFWPQISHNSNARSFVFNKLKRSFCCATTMMASHRPYDSPHIVNDRPTNHDRTTTSTSSSHLHNVVNGGPSTSNLSNFSSRQHNDQYQAKDNFVTSLNNNSYGDQRRNQYYDRPTHQQYYHSSSYTANRDRLIRGSYNSRHFTDNSRPYEQFRNYSTNSSSYNNRDNWSTNRMMNKNGTPSNFPHSNSSRHNNIEDIEVKKDFYDADPSLVNVNPIHVEEFRKQNGNIIVTSSDPNIVIPNPIMTFEQAFRCDENILEAIKSQNFKQPSHIQCQIWPILLSGHDAISISQTGSGKTLGFLLPGFVHSYHQTDERLKNDNLNPNILVICPTRELAQQTSAEVKKYAYYDFKSVCVYGGAPKGPQAHQIRNGCKIIVGTPGRINDFISNGTLNLSKITYLVLDEADVMLDMGFEPQIRSILEYIPKNRQTVMTSATWPPEARSLANQYLVNPIQVNVGETELIAAKTIKQIIEFDYDDEFRREKHLIEFLHTLNFNNDKVLVFVNTKDGARRLCHSIRSSNLKCETIHGNLDQAQRERALDTLKNNYCNILTATDVAARGLDISGITYVVNYTMPGNIEDYVHRIGRTGRAGKSGTAITYFTRENASMAKKLIELLRKADQTPDPRLFEMTKLNVRNRFERNRYTGYSGGGNSWSYQNRDSFGSRNSGSSWNTGGFSNNNRTFSNYESSNNNGNFSNGRNYFKREKTGR